ncbi:MarR family winged helix-turn-helix transcriptional regulator [Paenibacillus sp. CF384]|uniref:MarR family winged helix-turn-helix transcriptional regulator n=1 Tax=Paenibacillus sp. CF384 TaxID=1884382 RepID=UPI000899E701|nr:MarR family transcriptional regulator [Paenibacillus sp. CF384]SDW95970.1 DNA-binding transcriptional regulator, MarR family [Paenibacillus sp. CF384]
MNIDPGHLHRIEHELAIFMRRAEAARIAYFTNTGLDRSTYLLLRRLIDHGPLGIKALADTFQLDISTASRQTASLEAKGYVERTVDPKDARVSLLQATSTGREMLLKVRQLRQTFFTDVLKDWTEEESALFGELLERFNRTVEDHLNDSKCL